METMSGLDGLGWPNPEDEPKPTKSMSDTLETDAEVNELKSATTYNMVWAEFARKLERERDEARERIKNNPWCEACLEPDCCVSGDGTCAMIRKYLLAKSVDAKLATVTEQRDRLAAVLQRIRDGYGGQAATPNCCEDCDFLIPIDEALATSNQLNL
jgi:hypothetical protein